MEEETREPGEISGKESEEEGLHVDEVIGGVEQRRGGSQSSYHGIEEQTDRVLQGGSSNSTREEGGGGSHGVEEQFQQMPLKEQNNIVLGLHGDVDSMQYLNSNDFSEASANEDNPDYSTGRAAIDLDSGLDHAGSSPGFETPTGLGIKQSASCGSFESFSSPYASFSSPFAEGGYASPFGSPLKPKHKQNMPNVSPELLHLVDSAIMGKLDGMEKLKRIVSGQESFGRDEEAEYIALLVVDSLLATMGGVECFEEGEDNNPPSVMLNSRAATVAGELIPSLPCDGDFDGFMSPRTRMVKGLLAILRACTRNRSMCSKAGLLGVLLQSAEKIFVQDLDSTKQLKWDGTPMCHCIQYLAAHSLNVIDLNRWLHVITRMLTTVWANHLLLSLEKAVGGKESRGPACTFEFDGESSGLLGPGESPWPFTNGYGFATWIYVESFADTINTAAAAAEIEAAAAATSGKSSTMSAAATASALAGEGTKQMPRLFSFLSADNQGVEAYFHAQFLVVECGSGKGKKASLHFSHAFKPQHWYFIGLEHTCKQSLLGKAESELRLYIDGSLSEARPFDFPRISKPLAFCCIGTNPPPTMAGLQRRQRQCPLFAEMGPVYIFKEIIGPEKVARLASRGGDVLPSFGHGAGLPWLATNEHVGNLAEESTLLDAEIAGSLHLLYHPKLLSGRFCPDISPSGAAGTQRRPAEVIGQVHVASRMRPAEALWALAYGGPMSLLPLAVSNVHEDSMEPLQGSFPLSSATTSLSASIFRIISMAIQYPRNNEELRRTRGPEVLSRILNYLLRTLSSLNLGKQNGVGNEELVASVVSLCQSQKANYALKVQCFSTLLLDLKMWSLCNYGLQKKLLSSLADMVFTESSVMRDANAMQMLLDSCRRCYWVIREKDSVDTFSLHETPRPVGEVNALVDELLVVIELLVGGAASSFAIDDIRCLIGFLVDCPQPNQVARVLHLIYRLVVQPNKSRAHTFAESFISSGGIETLLVLLQREAKAGDRTILEHSCTKNEENGSVQGSAADTSIENGTSLSVGENEFVSHDEGLELQFAGSGINSFDDSSLNSVGRRTSVSENLLVKNLGGIGFSISADSARKNVYNIDNDDGIVVRIINLLGTLVASGHLKFGAHALPNLTSSILGNGLHDGGGTMFDDKLHLLLFALQKAFEAAPHRLMTSNVYMALLAASIYASTTDDGLNIYDHGHRFEHVQLLLVLLRALPYAPREFQVRAIQDILFLACSHPENRGRLTSMEEWPGWILEVLISNYERGSSNYSNGSSIADIEDLIHNFLIIMLEHSMRQKDGWKDIEATVHCAEWLSMVGGSSTGDQRMRREESLPIIKRRLLGGLLDFSAKELQIQTQAIAAAAAGVAAEGLSPEDAKLEAERAAHLSVALAENAIVILMLVEDHLRLQSQLYNSSRSVDVPSSPRSISNRSSSVGRGHSESFDAVSSQRLLSADSRGVSLDVLASVADPNGQISTEMMECLTAAAAAEPYESVRCAFISYGSCASDLSEGWKYRSRLWYGLGLPSKASVFGGGGSGHESWKTFLEKDASGNWAELPLVKQSVVMLQTLLLNESELGGGLGLGGGSGTGMGGMTALYQLLDSDQPFLCMLRMVLISMREEDNGEDSMCISSESMKDNISEGLFSESDSMGSESNTHLSTRKSRSDLLWSVLSPVLNMPVSESKRQRVLVASCILYSEVWHAVDKDKSPLRKQYIEAILPPFAAILRRWRPLLAGIHELTSSDGLNPLVVDDRSLATDALPLEAALAMISPGWAAAFASPPAAMGLAMIAAGAAGGETITPSKTTQLRRDSSMFERKQARLHTFSSFQQPLETQNKSPVIPKDKAAAKAAALAAARDLERNAKIGSGRGLSAVAMATSAQRRSVTDMARVRRWNDSEAMATAWGECLQSVDTKSVSGKEFNALCYKYIAVLVASFALARNMQRSEIDRHTQVNIIHRQCLSNGSRSWRKLIHCLIETRGLFGPFGERLCSPERIFWKLDIVESSSRMRRCLRRNYRGSDHMGASANYEGHLPMKNDQDNTISPTSFAVAEAISLEGANEYDEQTDGAPEASVQSEHVSEDNVATEVPTNEDLIQSPSAVAPGYVPSEIDERIIFELSSSMVRPLRITHGTFQVTTKRINFIVNERADDNAKDDEDPSSINRNPERDRSWLLSSLHQMFSRRYLLRRSSLELFMADRSNFFFDFGSIEGRKDAHRAIVQARPPHLNKIYLAMQRPEQLLKQSQLMERWARWEISNFEYLIQLNTLAGRSYNDITQYPVFPWILADYSSATLDLENHSSYRDLSKPVGALNADRLKKFQERYATADDSVIPKYHYDSHYSSARTVLYYLVRVEPFTTLSIQLQGGKFDHADKMFSDIGATWKGALEDMGDVKELVPEMFYLPESLVNVNSIGFGTTQLGGKLDSVRLPPWAENSVDFIHKHRKALESEHVSAHLHEWIDLIFGYKQRGKEAISANNVFFYITYEGTVDIDKISDPVQQRSMQDQISYLGQTPSQLLTVPHLKRRPLKDVLHLQTIFRNPTKVKPHVVPNPELCNLPAASIYASSDSVVVVDVNAPAAHVALHKWQPNTPDDQGTPFLFQHGKASTSSADGAFSRMFKGASSEDSQFPQSLAFATSGIRSSSVVAITSDKEIITGGHVDNSVKLISSDGAKTIETAEGHCAPVTCVALSPDCNHLVTGSQDTTVILWRVHRAPTSPSSISEPSTSSGTPQSSSISTFSNITDSCRRRRIQGPMHVLRGHVREIICCCVNSDLGVVVSCSFSSGILLHSIRRGRMIRRLSGVDAQLVCLSSEGVILTWNKEEKRLCTFTINGAPIATANLSFSGIISCMEVSVDGQSALIGTSSSLENGGTYDFGGEAYGEGANKQVELSTPSISFFDLHTLKVFHTLKLGKKQDITTLALNKDNTNLLVSTADKQLIVFTNPALSKNS